MKTIVVCSGYFDPITTGQVKHLYEASKMGPLIVILNNDNQAKAIKRKILAPQSERIQVLKVLPFVKEVFVSIDQDKTVCKSIERLASQIEEGTKILFAKGGKRHSGEIPEAAVCKKRGIVVVDGVGGVSETSNAINNLDKKEKVSLKLLCNSMS